MVSFAWFLDCGLFSAVSLCGLLNVVSLTRRGLLSVVSRVAPTRNIRTEVMREDELSPWDIASTRSTFEQIVLNNIS